MEKPVDDIEASLRSILGQCFRDKFYKDGIEELRNLIFHQDNYSEKWESIVRCIAGRDLQAGKALDLIHKAANLVLDENTENEAYAWLVLMITNASKPQGAPIYEY